MREVASAADRLVQGRRRKGWAPGHAHYSERGEKPQLCGDGADQAVVIQVSVRRKSNSISPRGASGRGAASASSPNITHHERRLWSGPNVIF